MEVFCEGCAGCCIDWRPLLDPERREEIEHEGPRRDSIDDVSNLVPLTRDEVRAFLEAGLGDALIPRLWETDERDEYVEVDGYQLAAIAGRPVFFIGLRKPPKPVAPFGRAEPTWLPTCAFLDPETLQCRIHGTDVYPSECAEYPAHNVALEQESECERVESVFDGERLRLEGSSTGDGDEGVTVDVEATDTLLLGPQAVGQKLFVHPSVEDLEGRIDRLASGTSTTEDRAAFVAVAAASAPGTLAISEPHSEEAHERVLEADSWVGRATREWENRHDSGAEPDSSFGSTLEESQGAPETPGWDSST